MRRWMPLLDRDDRAEAHRAIEAIVEALRSPGIAMWSEPGVAGGRAGMAVLYAHLARAFPGQGYEDRAASAMDAAISAMADTILPPALFGGFTGIGWAVEHVRDDLADIDGETSDPIDEAVLTWVARQPWDHDYDLISGLVGFGVYALELLAAVSDVEPRWDRLLLCRIPM